MPGPVSDSYDPVFSTAANCERWVECCRAAARRLLRRFGADRAGRVDVDDLAYAMAEAAHEMLREAEEDAIREGERAVELMPAGKNALEGAMLTQYLAVIYAWTGDKNRAIERLAEAAKLPDDLSYGHLRLNPLWDPVRSDPRFGAIVASLAPK